jgi:hypothetical protein
MMAILMEFAEQDNHGAAGIVVQRCTVRGRQLINWHDV